MCARIPTQRRASGQSGDCGPHEFAEATISGDLYLDQLGYLTPVPRFEKYTVGAVSHGAGYARAGQSGRSALCPNPTARKVMAPRPGGRSRVGGRDRHRHDLFRQSRNATDARRSARRRSRIPIATTAMGRAYLGPAPRPSAPRCCANCGITMAAAGPGCATASSAAEMMAKTGLQFPLANADDVAAVVLRSS